jgi:5-methylcytosine-specific restriction endonuclease McrA
MFAEQDGRCRYCRTRIDEAFEIDHWIPLSKGGSNYPENLVLACPSCNAAKRDKLPHDFLKRF